MQVACMLFSCIFLHTLHASASGSVSIHGECPCRPKLLLWSSPSCQLQQAQCRPHVKHRSAAAQQATEGNHCWLMTRRSHQRLIWRRMQACLRLIWQRPTPAGHRLTWQRVPACPRLIWQPLPAMRTSLKTVRTPRQPHLRPTAAACSRATAAGCQTTATPSMAR